MILTRIFDKIMDLKGDFQVLEFNVGKKKKESSYARLLVQGKDRHHLHQILESVYMEGAQSVSVEQVILEPAEKDMVMADNFYSTTNNATQIYYDKSWVDVDDMMMDKCIVVDIFQFMSSSSSSERPTQQIARKVAIDLHTIKKSGGRIIVVSGPVLIHSGAAESFAKFIRMGYVDGLLAGNALAVHDVENALLGTYLGMNVTDGTLSIRGHRNHMQAINEIFKAGSLKAMVEKGILKKGVMYECITNDIPFVLAGSVRDDGPIPDVITDVVEAQREYKKITKDTKMVLMLSTMLHSIAVGNMLPAEVKVIAVDISQPVVTKLLDRGTSQAVGIVTDVGAFFPIIVECLEQLTTKTGYTISDK